ncbi:MAG: hypothetical protein GY870_11355 [archaeon]|nr:hypothetical protein [archaeon]
MSEYNCKHHPQRYANHKCEKCGIRLCDECAIKYKKTEQTEYSSFSNETTLCPHCYYYRDTKTGGMVFLFCFMTVWLGGFLGGPLYILITSGFSSPGNYFLLIFIAIGLLVLFGCLRSLYNRFSKKISPLMRRNIENQLLQNKKIEKLRNENTIFDSSLRNLEFKTNFSLGGSICGIIFLIIFIYIGAYMFGNTTDFLESINPFSIIYILFFVLLPGLALIGQIRGLMQNYDMIVLRQDKIELKNSKKNMVKKEILAYEIQSIKVKAVRSSSDNSSPSFYLKLTIKLTNNKNKKLRPILNTRNKEEFQLSVTKLFANLEQMYHFPIEKSKYADKILGG